jgi:hypothetical protein
MIRYEQIYGKLSNAKRLFFSERKEKPFMVSTDEADN